MRSLSLALLLLAAATTAIADPLYVTNTHDSGPGSLRAAMEAANERRCGIECTIELRIPAPVPERGWFTIQPLTPLPYLYRVQRVKIDGGAQTRFTGDTNPFGPEIEIDGSRAGLAPGIKLVETNLCEVNGLAVNRFGGNGVVIDHGTNDRIIGNYIGVDPAGVGALPNGFNGVAVIRSSSTSLQHNIISGNRSNGVFALNLSHLGLQWNRIGTGRVDGIRIPNGANGVDFTGVNSFIYEGAIHNNAHYGVKATGAHGLKLFQVSIADNGFGPFVRDQPRDLPELTRARATTSRSAPGLVVLEIEGTLRTHANRKVVIDFYASPNGADARVPLGFITVTTDADGFARFTFGNPSTQFVYPKFIPGGWITATATTDDGTSELSGPVALQTTAIEVTSTDDSGPGSLRAAIEAANAADPAAPAWIAFRLGAGFAQIAPRAPLPAITRSDVILDGESQTYWAGDDNAFGPELEIRGTLAGEGAAGLRIGTESAPVKRVIVRGLLINGFGGDGIVVHAHGAVDSRIAIEGCHVGVDASGHEARPNGGNGITLRGGSGAGFLNAPTLNVVRSCVIGGNRRHGIVSEGVGHEVKDSKIGVGPRGFEVVGNGNDGIRFASGSLHTVRNTVIANNGGAGVNVQPGVLGVLIDAETRDNGWLGIERAEENVPHAPELFEAFYDAATNRTTIRGSVTHAFLQLPGRQAGSGTDNIARFYASRKADPSGRGEGERLIMASVFSPLTAQGSRFTVSVEGDLRGRFITAVNDLQYCYWEFGCHSLDTSEHSNAVPVTSGSP